MSQLSRYRALGFALAAMLITSAIAPAASLTGTVINGTSRKPAAGDEVVLLTLSQSGMNEIARTETDSSGTFSLRVPDGQGAYLVRAVHQGVTYHHLVGVAVHSVTIKVYDVAEQLDAVTAIMDVQRFEATGDMLEVKQLITVRNASKPPRTLMNDRPFEIHLPPEAQVQSGLVQIEDGQPLKNKPVPGDRKGQYYFLFPLRPGDTRLAVVYRLPYNGAAVIEPELRNSLEQFVVMLPKSMKFEPKVAGIFQPMADVTSDNVQTTPPVKPGQVLGFGISGTGMLEELKGRSEQAQVSQTARPGGGLGPPAELPDPLQNNRWFIFGGLAIVLVLGATYVASRPVSRAAEHAALRTPGRKPSAERQTKAERIIAPNAALLRRSRIHAGRRRRDVER